MSVDVDDSTFAELAEEIATLRRQVKVLSTNQERIENTADRAVQGLDELEEQLESTAAAIEAAAQIQPVTAAESQSDGGGESEDGETAQAEPLDVDVLYDWVVQHISQWAQRKIPTTTGSSGFRWCAEWFEHPEAITRLWTLRLAWLEAVGQPGSAMWAYLHNCLDPTLNALSSDTGPFHSCSPMKHEPDKGFLDSAPAPWRQPV
ncbi:DUF4913 domain-containing protein [Rhodococcus hoagii]|nr:DUF4913 domain-containing protein [Prescottella equi]NKS35214.1 DUF4913 domain-containing protein [Prescottella equi]NKS62119.1 DUF4913 domain-containing protein [Prescottella equi]NKS68268.1 DUF4913 domain-containing protein [Prescottella equi]NKS73017.1 DUF4913 domain-containing protein [Prescottella equi]